MRSPKAVLREKINEIANPKQRYVDFGAAFRIYRRDKDGIAAPAELLPNVFGGRWDTWSKRYNGPAQKPAEFSIHPGQVEIVTGDHGVLRHVLLLGAPGGGKTDTAVLRGIRNALEIPGGNHGLIAPTHARLQILWQKVLRLLTPLGWVESIRYTDRLIRLKNGSQFVFLAAKRQSDQLGSPIAGWDFHSCVVDESQYVDDESMYEIEARGRVNKRYVVVETATNEQIREFTQRVARYGRSEKAKIIRVRGDDNVFTPLDHWEALKEQLPPDVYERKVLGLDIAPSDAVFPQYSSAKNIKRLPDVWRNATSELVARYFPSLGEEREIEWILGTDLGILVTATIAIQAIAAPAAHHEWWARHEITTRNNTADYHADNVLRWCETNRVDPKSCLVVYDSHGQSQSDDSDASLLRRAGLTLVKSHHTTIRVKHRLTMQNSLFCDAKGQRSLFLECDEFSRVKCPELHDALVGLRYGPDGNPNAMNKSVRDQTHWPDALSHGLFPFESFRGQATVVSLDEKRSRSWASNPFLA